MDFDIIVIGSGIAGASSAYELAQHYQVLVLEMETQPGYHATGRSAALFTETYGHKVVRSLASCSRNFLESPPEGFCETPLLKERGRLSIGSVPQQKKLRGTYEIIAQEQPHRVAWVRLPFLLEKVPALNPEYVVAGIWEPGAKDIDVHTLHQGYLKGMLQRGGMLLTECPAMEITPISEGWEVTTPSQRFTARWLINAAGAWAEQIGQMAGASLFRLTPQRRTAVLFTPPEAWNVSHWPMVADIDEKFYFKPDVHKLLASPADETPEKPHDVTPRDTDIAILAERLKRVLSFEVRHVTHKWAGLRTFAVDKKPVVGWDPHVGNFFWFAGQGGYGISLAPALARYACDVFIGKEVPPDLQQAGISEKDLSPARFF